MEFKDIKQTVLHKNFPLGLVAPAWIRDEVPFSKFTSISDLLRDFMGSLIDERVDSIDDPGHRLTVRQVLIANWYKKCGWPEHEIPSYLHEQLDSKEDLKTALASLYTAYSFEVSNMDKGSEGWEASDSLRSLYNEVPALLAPFAARLSPADNDVILNYLKEKPALRRITRYLEEVHAPEWQTTDIREKPERRREIRKFFFQSVVRYAAAESIAGLVERYFDTNRLVDNGFNRQKSFRKGSHAVFNAMHERVLDALESPFANSPKQVQFVPEKGAVYHLLYPLPKFLVVPRVGMPNFMALDEKKSESISRLAGQKLVELDMTHKYSKRVKNVSDIEKLTPECYTASFSSNPVVTYVPRCVLKPDFNSDKVDYTFGCGDGCENWRREYGRMFYWHPFYEIWTLYGTSDRHAIKQALSDSVQASYDIEYTAVKACPFCGSTLTHGHPYLIRGNLPISRRAYNFEEDYLEIKTPHLKYHVDLWDRILQFYFKSEYLDQHEMDIVNNYVFISGDGTPSGEKVQLRLSGENLWVGDTKFNKRDLMHLCFTLYQTKAAYERAIFGLETATDFGEEEIGHG